MKQTLNFQKEINIEEFLDLKIYWGCIPIKYNTILYEDQKLNIEFKEEFIKYLNI